MNVLNKLYREGLIIYPRTESDYISNKRLFSYNPHPKIKAVSDYLSPLEGEFYPFNQNSMLLHFHNIRAITPSNYVATKNKVNEILKKPKNILLEVTENYDSFIQENKKITRNYFIEELINHYNKEKPKIKAKNIKAKYCSFDEYLEDRKSNITINGDIVAKNIDKGGQIDV